ncbi:MAG: hypothetical protein EBY21_07675 [Alphaproteobacteria bacterium]|nr:hypothetical protein [Alphaproteobacteria bacterium]
MLATPTQAGFLEVLFGQPSNRSSFLFGGQQASPLSPEEEAERQKQNRLASERQMSEQAGRNLKIFRVLADIAHEQGRKQAFLMDPTLRYGDIVVTDTGFEVYEGKSWKERSPLQFRPLHLSSLRNRKDLQVLQKASGFPAAREEVQTASTIRTLTIIGQSNAQPTQARATDSQPTASQARAGSAAPKETKPRLEIIKPAQSAQTSQVMNRQAMNRQSASTSAPARPQATQNKQIRQEAVRQQAVSPLAANVFYLFR